ncbi:hypothetical protein Aperf_G00000013910 [Anoplocephala perfoliata]
MLSFMWAVQALDTATPAESLVSQHCRLIGQFASLHLCNAVLLAQTLHTDKRTLISAAAAATATVNASTLATLCIAIILPHWPCGSLFEGCTQKGAAKRDVMLAVTCCLVIGVTMLAVVCIIDFIQLCSTTRSGVERAARLALLYIGSILTLVAVILYTVEISQSWSYFLATCGAIFAIQLALLTLVYGKFCGKYTAGARINENY